jgi:hypothetical protein
VSEIQTETVGNAPEAECYSEASSAAFIFLFLMSITSLFIEREMGINPRRPAWENRGAIGYKEHRVHSGLSESTESPGKSRLKTERVLTRQNCGRLLARVLYDHKNRETELFRLMKHDLKRLAIGADVASRKHSELQRRNRHTALRADGDLL